MKLDKIDWSRVQHQLDFQQLIYSISSKFIAIKDTANAIMESLKELSEFSGANRAYVFEFDTERMEMSNTFEWCQEGVTPEIDNLKNLPTSIFPWWMEKLIKGEVIDVTDVSRMPDEAREEKAILQMQGIKSVLVLPIIVQQELWGFIGFDNVNSTGVWSDDDLTLLKITSEIFSHAFERLKSEEQLREYTVNLKSMLSQLKEAQSRMIQQERMVGIGQLASGIAHEINNPLGYMISGNDVLKNNIRQIKELLINGGSIDGNEFLFEDSEEIISDMDEGLKKVSKIVNTLKEFSNIGYDKISSYNLNEGINNSITIVENELREIEVELLLDEIPLITCEPSQINQAIMNLILNSIYAIKEVENRRGRLVIESGHDDRNIYFKIRDNGKGMPNEIINEIFNPFFTTKPEGVGTGLGLSIAYDIIVKKHNGHIDVFSELGAGTVFEVKLPMNTIENV